MIWDQIEQIARYEGSSPRLERVARFLRETDLKQLPLGRTDIQGEEIYVNHMTYTTAEQREEDLYEAHGRYLDLHLVLSGREAVSVAPIETLALAEVREAEDSTMYRGRGAVSVPLTAGSFLLLYPGEGHLPKLALNGETAQVDKLVFKIDTFPGAGPTA